MSRFDYSRYGFYHTEAVVSYGRIGGGKRVILHSKSLGCEISVFIPPKNRKEFDEIIAKAKSLEAGWRLWQWQNT